MKAVGEASMNCEVVPEGITETFGSQFLPWR